MMLSLYIVLFCFWAIFGSFAGVILERWRWWFARWQFWEVFWGRSKCPDCEKNGLIPHYLKWRQLIPIIGRLIQRWSCVTCKKSIPSWYPLFEISMGGLFVLVGYLLYGNTIMLFDMQWGLLVPLILWCLVVRTLRSIIIADLLRYELNVWMRLVLMTLVLYQFWPWDGQWAYLMSGGILFLLYLGIRYAATLRVKQKTGQIGEWFGFGDVLMAFPLGMFFPFFIEQLTYVSYIQIVLLYMVLSSFLGIVFWISRRIATWEENQHIPFLPAMIFAAVILFFWWERLVALL